MMTDLERKKPGYNDKTGAQKNHDVFLCTAGDTVPDRENPVAFLGIWPRQ